ncbi:hypothetical protein [Streptomyces sp. CRN 30]|uniref:hypothetical protein n=1 Tax=Streptomyces sp. CRN 30 TaxID=3075613 RepID=UPI002A8378A4|nr:hypothetical protein [Streptomyces sp. CRN 30]
MPTYTVNYGAFNEVIEQLQVLQTEIDTLNEHYSSGNADALAEWNNQAKELWEARKTEWVTAANAMKEQAKAVQVAADNCRQEYQSTSLAVAGLWAK